MKSKTNLTSDNPLKFTPKVLFPQYAKGNVTNTKASPFDILTNNKYKSMTIGTFPFWKSAIYLKLPRVGYFATPCSESTRVRSLVDRKD